MKLLFPNLLIKTRIYGGFTLVCAFIVVLSVLSFLNASKTSSYFKRYQSTNEQYTTVLSLGDKISKIQNDVHSYTFTGYEATAAKISRQLNSLEMFFQQMESLFDDRSMERRRLEKLGTHLLHYGNTFSTARDQALELAVMLEELNSITKKLLHQDSQTENVKLFVINSKSSLFEYLYDPDMEKITAVQEKFHNYILTAHHDDASDLIKYRRAFGGIIQAKRNYLYLVTVVMAGEAFEIKNISNRVVDVVLLNKINEERKVVDSIEELSFVAVISSFILVTMGTAISYFTSRSIVLPLNQLTITFENLSGDKEVSSIPGVMLQDEIGSMSRAADVFRVKNRENKFLMLSLKEEKSKLVASNRELEQFAFVTSHDLQEPLRTIQNFTDLFEEDYGSSMDNDGRQYLKFISDAALRMEQQIFGVLEYSRIGKQKSFQKISINEIVENITQDKSFCIENIDSNISIQPHIPLVSGSEVEIGTLLRNLISNSLKFSKPELHNQVDVGFEFRNGETVFFVQDNGIGIEPENHEVIFEMFKRLQNRDEYPGHGIGLSHCKKIVESHGGELWLDKEYSGGCRFMFTFWEGSTWEIDCAA